MDVRRNPGIAIRFRHSCLLDGGRTKFGHVGCACSSLSIKTLLYEVQPGDSRLLAVRAALWQLADGLDGYPWIAGFEESLRSTLRTALHEGDMHAQGWVSRLLTRDFVFRLFFRVRD
jgi:hypothetical protein